MAVKKTVKQTKKVTKKTKTEEKVAKIPAINFKWATMTIVGDSPLLINAFNPKVIQQLNDSQQGKAKTKKPPRDPQAEYEGAFYTMKGGTKKKPKYGMPASGIRLAAISACRYVDLKMTQTLGAFHVIAESNGLVEIKSKKGPVMDESIVRVGGFGNKQPMTRYRPRWDDWSVTFKIRYNANVITAEQLANLYENAGFAVGLCEWRPEKKGSHGMFHVKRGA